MINKIILGLAAVAILPLSTGCSVFGVRSEEQPKYKVLVKEGKNEIRHYEPRLIAKTTVSGDYKEAQRKAFRILADYIFGNNTSQTKIAMTAPVTQSSKDPSSEKIAMTAPVTIGSPSANDSQIWTMAFTMPSEYTKETLPLPNDDRIKIEVIPAAYMAAHQYSGTWGREKNQKMEEKLKSWLLSIQGYKQSKTPKFAGYDPPWTLPFLRRNEILLELTQK